MKVIVTGPRNWGEGPNGELEKLVLETHLDACLESAISMAGELLVIHGDAKGADTIAKLWALEHCAAGHKSYPALWRDRASKTFCSDKGYDPYAGHRRNQRMIEDNKGSIDEVLACRRYGNAGWTRGTGDMAARCIAAGLLVVRVEC